MVALLALLQLQLSPAAPPPLEVARHALHRADTSAAVAALIGIVRPDTAYPSEETAALLLLRWIGRSPSQDSVMAVWERGLRAVRRTSGAIWPIGHETQFVLRELDEGRGDREIAEALGGGRATRARPWQERLREAALDTDGADALTRAAAQWVATMGWLADLDRFASTLPTVVPPAGCQRGCMVRQVPRQSLPLLHRLRATGPTATDLDVAWSEANDTPSIARGATLDRLWTALDALRPSPWPFNELAERLRVTLCALLRIEPLAAASSSFVRAGGDGGDVARGPADAADRCAPVVGSLDSVVAAELAVVHYESERHRGLAARAMGAAPERFAALDTSLELLFTSPAVGQGSRPARMTRRVPRGAPSRSVAPPGFWRTAWPLYLVPYNERLIVHRARLLLADMSRRFATGGDVSNLFDAYGDPGTLVRIGVPLALARPEGTQGLGLITYMPLQMHETIVRRGHGMEGVSLDLALAARNSANPLAVSGFRAEGYDTFGPLDHQVVQYVRDGQQHVEIYTRWIRSPRCERPRPLLGFFLLDSHLRMLSRAVDVSPTEPPRLKRFHLRPAAGTYVYSLEMLDRSCRTAERARYVLRVRPVDSVRISDLMLADELFLGDERRTARIESRPPVTLRPSLTFDAGMSARFYWEVYGVAADSMEVGRLQVTFEVVNVREGRVAVRELGDVAAQARGRRGTLDLQYDQTIPAGTGPLGFGLAVGIPEGTRGVHVARVHITDTRTGETVSAERAFFVRE